MAHFHLSMKVQPQRSDGGRLSAKSHFDYIARENQYAHMRGRQEDFVLSESGNLPDWANGQAGAGKFWQEAEDHRSARGRAYREVEIGLQEELSLEDNLKLLHDFMHEFHIDQYAYTFAIHSKNSTLETGHKNIHVHLMFNEKIQEKNRPLGPEKFFSRYSKNENGELTGGYRSSREFTSKDMLMTMRKRWSEMVNEKFKERGIAAEITEKNNADRYDELTASGRSEEAEMVNRPAAPHLGKAYRSASVLAHVRDLEYKEEVRDWEALQDGQDDQSEEAEKEAADKRLKKFAEQNSREQKLLLFINDMQIRKLARKLQLEREKYRKQQLMEQQDNKQLPDPVTITVEDVSIRMREEEDRLHREAQEALEDYKELRTQIRSDKMLKNDAVEAVLGHQWRLERQRYLGLKGTLRVLQKQILNRRSVEEQKQFNRRVNKVAKALREAEKIQADYKLDIKKHQAEILAVYTPSVAKNNQKKAASRKAYAVYKQKGKLERQVHDKRVLLEKQNAPDTILYAEKLARQVQPWCKLYGQDKLDNLPNLTLVNDKSQRFYITGTPRWYKNKQVWVARAVRLHDDMKNGKAPLYKVTLEKTKVNFKGKEVDAIKIKAVENTKEWIPMYKAVERKPKRCTQGKFAAKSPQVQNQTHTGNKAAVAAAREINRLAAEAMQSDTGRLNVHWQDDERKYIKKTKLERVEQELYGGR